MKRRIKFQEKMQAAMSGQKYEDPDFNMVDIIANSKRTSEDAPAGQLIDLYVRLGTTKYLDEALLKSMPHDILIQMVKRDVAENITKQLYGEVIEDLLELKKMYRNMLVDKQLYEHDDPISAKIDEILEMIRP